MKKKTAGTTPDPLRYDCPFCGKFYSMVALDRHIVIVHLELPYNSETRIDLPKQEPNDGELAKRKKKAQHQKGKRAGTQNRIILESKRGQRATGGRCDECGITRKTLWHYSKSSKGAVSLCSVCKPKVFDRSFGSVDAMKMAVSGGAPESNRRRH